MNEWALFIILLIITSPAWVLIGTKLFLVINELYQNNQLKLPFSNNTLPDWRENVFEKKKFILKKEKKLKPSLETKRKITALKEKDPLFNEHVFQDKISTTVFMIKKAWSKRNMKQVKELMTESIFLRYTIQLEEYIKTGTYNKLEDFSIQKMLITDVTSDKNFDVIKILIFIKSADYIVDENGFYYSGLRGLKQWQEEWSFIRAINTPTNSGYNCPNCGASLKSDVIKMVCKYCKSSLSSYYFGWILSDVAIIE